MATVKTRAKFHIEKGVGANEWRLFLNDQDITKHVRGLEIKTTPGSPYVELDMRIRAELTTGEYKGASNGSNRLRAMR